MHINNNSSTNFGAIFRYTKTADPACEIVENALKASTVKAEAEKIRNKFQVGGGSLYVYVPDENMQKLLDNLKYVAKNAYTELLTRVD